MKKDTIRDVAVSCCAFLVFVFMLSLVMDHYMPQNSETTMAVSKAQDKKVVYLTFDDGPSIQTEKILNILDSNKIKATFFVTGEYAAYENMIAKEYKKGHAIGVHTYSHDYKSIYASGDAYLADMNKMNAIIKKQIGHNVHIMRFPGGSSNTVSRIYQTGIMSELSKTVETQGFQYYDWNASNGDGDCSKSSDELVSIAQSEVKEQQAVVMLLHDGAGNRATVEALPRIIEMLQQKGYEFKVIDDTTRVVHHHIAN